MRWYRATAVALLTAALGLAAAFTVGSLAIVTTNGISMRPRITAGDLVVVARSTSYGIGDSVAYRSELLHTVVLHRIVAVEGDRFVFKGDNNSWLDPVKPTADHLVGKELLHIPRGGIWLKRLTSPPALAASSILLLGGGSAAVARTKRQRRKERRTVSARHRSTPSHSLGTMSPGLQPVVATAAAVGLVGLALAGLSWTRPTTAAESLSAGSSIDFSYSATVPASAAYDGTSVTAPQPVFRNLTDTVDVSYDYSGRPGTVAVDAVLSTAGGWTTTLPLTPREPLASKQHGQVRLDLPALEARAAAAAAVTGIPASSLTVTVIPRIAIDGGGDFAPELPLTLDALTLKASEAALHASTSSTEPGTGPAQLAALGRKVSVATARTVSLAALLLAGLMGLTVLALTRLAGPTTETNRIKARYRDLLLPVHPVVLTPGRPVIDVPSIEALATLAQRYGLLVLHWERSGTTTYVVQDEASTYRYRSTAAVITQTPSVDLLPVS